MTGPVTVEFIGTEFHGLRFPLPGLSNADVLEAWRLVQAGQMDAPEVLRLKASLLAGFGPLEQWGPGDDAALCIEAQPGREGWL